MKIGIIGAGSVGQTFGKALSDKGHDVVIGIRKVSPEELAKERNWAQPLDAWLKTTKAKVGTFADAAKHGEILFNVTSGAASVDALKLAGADNMKGKILIDVANPLDFSRGMPPSLHPHLSNTWSLGEEIQKTFPDVKVVKAFNTISAAVMVNGAAINAPHDLFVCGNDAAAKEAVKALAKEQFGWQHFSDLGDISGARGQEAILHIWLRLWAVTGTPMFNLHVAHA
jgi:8-hydroxy-5-deazaflavin:NADPH oxidoreductase